MSSENVLTRKNKYKFQVQFIKNKITFLNLFNFNFNLFLVCFFFHQVFGRRCKRFHYETGDNFRLQKAQGLHEERRRRSGREWDQQEKATRAVWSVSISTIYLTSNVIHIITITITATFINILVLSSIIAHIVWFSNQTAEKDLLVVSRWLVKSTLVLMLGRRRLLLEVVTGSIMGLIFLSRDSRCWLNCYFDVAAMLPVVIIVVLYCSIVDSFWIWIVVY